MFDVHVPSTASICFPVCCMVGIFPFQFVLFVLCFTMCFVISVFFVWNVAVCCFWGVLCGHFLRVQNCPLALKS